MLQHTGIKHQPANQTIHEWGERSPLKLRTNWRPSNAHKHQENYAAKQTHDGTN